LFSKNERDHNWTNTVFFSDLTKTCTTVPQQFLPLIQAPVLPAKVTEAQKISGLSLSIPVPSGKVEGPAPDLDFMTTNGKLKRVLPLPSDVLRASKSVI
jgi:hypothetical protein